MKIEKIEIENFRGFKGKHEVVFQPDVNVFIGVNGAGKSSILDLLGMVMGQLIQRVTPNYASPLTLSNTDISFETMDNTDISFETIRLPIQARFLAKEGFAVISPFYMNIGLGGFITNFVLTQYREGAPQLEIILKSQLRNYPIFRYFHNKRVWQNTEEITDLKSIPSQMSAYSGCFDSLNSFEKFAKWFKDQEDSENRIKIRTKNINFEAPVLKTVRTAINTFLSHFENLKMENIRVEDLEMGNGRIDDFNHINYDINHLCLDKNGVKHNLNQLSSGEQTIILLVADMAYRLAVANPNLDDKTDGTGIVLIDEIDIHLHPEWQRDIVIALTKTFPNIQFFITSHSPFIASSVHKSQLHILQNEGGQSHFKTSFFNPYGKPADQVLIDFFQLKGTRTRKVDTEFEILREMVKKGEYETEAFKVAYESLVSDIGKADHDLISVNLEIAKRKKIYEKNH